MLDEKEAEKGILVAFKGGSICEGSDTPSLNGQPRKVIFRLECGEEQDKAFILNEPGHTQGSTKCELHFKIKTPVACPWYVSNLNEKNRTWGIAYWSLVLLAMFLIYNIAGMIYN